MCFPDAIEAKRAAAIALLGDKWVLHPEYSAAKNPQHALSVRRSAVLAKFCATRQRKKRPDYFGM